ncbi:hypothetical protein QBC35DRAFT_266621 [Podospora australis]|uniref:Glutamyl-tRNA amidotransferase complex subunit Gta3 domain-containing protein n=1 Tax=Podospora australis TaxID=1536484 RepID=A0AAN6WR22_9PEZI|nr:hypothetical protein QBC35DRAFT_266621 [Podospora australis]
MSRLRPQRLYSTFIKSVSASSKIPPPKINPHDLLRTPTWSISSLLPPSTSSASSPLSASQSSTSLPTSRSSNSSATSPDPPSTSQPPAPVPHSEQAGTEITEKQLHHLLKLSALPTPTTPEATTRILSTLKSQLHFVAHIQSVPTPDSLLPLRAIRDETPAGLAESTISLSHPSIQQALANEEIHGKCKRPRRRRDISSTNKTGQEEGWDRMGSASHKAGGGEYFVVRSGKGAATESKD